jgi:hypothetical protein
MKILWWRVPNIFSSRLAAYPEQKIRDAMEGWPGSSPPEDISIVFTRLTSSEPMDPPPPSNYITCWEVDEKQIPIDEISSLLSQTKRASV